MWAIQRHITGGAGVLLCYCATVLLCYSSADGQRITKLKQVDRRGQDPEARKVKVIQ